MAERPYDSDPAWSQCDDVDNEYYDEGLDEGESEDQPKKRFRFIYDTSISIDANSKEEADRKLEEVEMMAESMGASINTYDAYGIEDNETGKEVRLIH